MQIILIYRLMEEEQIPEGARIHNFFKMTRLYKARPVSWTGHWELYRKYFFKHTYGHAYCAQSGMKGTQATIRRKEIFKKKIRRLSVSHKRER